MAEAFLAAKEPCAGWLDERRRSALSACVSDILHQFAPNPESNTDGSGAMYDVLSAVHMACAEFATKWNYRNPHAPVMRLPFEVLTACLDWADQRTRIRASHVSRRWREFALAERRLWTDYRWTSLSSLRFLEAALRRSSPLPIRLTFPLRHANNMALFAPRVADLVTPNLHRLQAYTGPAHLLFQLNPHAIPLPGLHSLNIDEEGGTGILPTCTVGLLRCLPNLRRLSAAELDFRGQWYPNLRELVCTLERDEGIDLFRSCPNLVRAEFRGRPDSRLPRGPVPRSIREIDIHCYSLRHGWTGINVSAVDVWAGEHIPKLVFIGGAELLSTIVYRFLKDMGPTRVGVSLDEPSITLTDAAEPSGWCLAVSTPDLWPSPRRASDLARLFGNSVHIVALTVCIRRLDALLSAQIDAPHLLSLELSLAGYRGQPPSFEQGDSFIAEINRFNHQPPLCLTPSQSGFILARHLQQFTIDMCWANADSPGIDTLLRDLTQNFRQVVVYDSELLETVTVRSPAHDGTGVESDCAALARFARHYIEIP